MGRHVLRKMVKFVFPGIGQLLFYDIEMQGSPQDIFKEHILRDMFRILVQVTYHIQDLRCKTTYNTSNITTDI